MTSAVLPASVESSLQQGLTGIGWAFHRQVAKVGSTTDPRGLVAIAAGVLMRETVGGHTCLPVEVLEQLTAEFSRTVVGVGELSPVLRLHPWVGTGDGTTPLVLEGDRFYLRRFRDAEVRLAAAIRSRIASPPMDDALPALAARFRKIFPASSDTDWQAVAVAAALRSRLSLIAGGPGTGKTTTVARLLAILIDRDPYLRFALAAPTGKAAARLGEAVQEALITSGLAPISGKEGRAGGQTLHRLLGYRPQDDTFRQNESDPLEHDIVIVDEASMVPLLLMDALFAAVRPDARIVLLGDHQQLASVEAGSILAELVKAVASSEPGYGDGLRSAYAVLSGDQLPADPDATPLRDAVVQLRRSHRFDDSNGIGALARAVRDGDADAAFAALEASDGSVARGATVASSDDWLGALAEPASDLLASPSPQAALAALGRIRVLCATNVGPAGTEALTVRIERMLRGLGLDVSGQSYRGRPLLVKQNDYELGLFNGDVGIVWSTVELDGSEGLRAFFPAPTPGNDPMSFALQELPEVATAWAMTVHKSQGSEFDTVIVVLPDTDVPTLTRELLYTAVTRARSRLIVVGPEKQLRQAMSRVEARGSGLADRLRQ